jgi:hypothetical protein
VPTLVVQLTAGDASICTFDRKLLVTGSNPASRLEAWRNGALALAAPLGTFARLRVADDRHGTPRFRLHTPARVAGLGQHAPKSVEGTAVPGQPEKPAVVSIANGHKAQSPPPDLAITAISKGKVVPSRCVVRPAAIRSCSDRIRLRRAISRCPRTSSP